MVVYENSHVAYLLQKRNRGFLASDDPVSLAGIKARARNGMLEQPTVASMIWDIWESEW